MEVDSKTTLSGLCTFPLPSSFSFHDLSEFWSLDRFSSASSFNRAMAMLKVFNLSFRRLYRRLRWPIRPKSKPGVVIKKFGKTGSQSGRNAKTDHLLSGSALVHPNGLLDGSKKERHIRIATFNAALFSMAPVVQFSERSESFDAENGDGGSSRRSDLRGKSLNDRPKGILKQSPLHSSSVNGSEIFPNQTKFPKSKLRVSINLPDNEISLLRNRQSSFSEYERDYPSSSQSSNDVNKVPRVKAPAVKFYPNMENRRNRESVHRCSRTVVEVLRELDADILALQDVKAEEEKAMKPLSDLASALGMSYVFAESWAPEYGNAVLSKWPIKRWKVQKIFDDTDFRNVLKVTIDVPDAGEINLDCTHLDHLDEDWRMKQINAIIQSTNQPHILAGALNFLDQTDYSQQRWTDIARYYEEMGKPVPKVEVMKHLKNHQYTDAKDFAGECESVVMIAKGQSVQGTCKYGTRVDYILASPNSPYKFVPGSYSVISSKGTSDHHIVKVDVAKPTNISNHNSIMSSCHPSQHNQRTIKITHSSPPPCIWKIST